MKNSTNSYNENNITEILASTGFIFPRNLVELRNFDILFGNNDFGLSGQEIDPDLILSKNRIRPKMINLSEARNYLADDMKLVAKKEEDSFDMEIKKLFKKPKNSENSEEK